MVSFCNSFRVFRGFQSLGLLFHLLQELFHVRFTPLGREIAGKGAV